MLVRYRLDVCWKRDTVEDGNQLKGMAEPRINRNSFARKVLVNLLKQGLRTGLLSEIA